MHVTKYRIKELDTIRGIALFGILMVNILIFNAPYYHFYEYYGEFSDFQLSLTKAIHLLFGNKMMPLFALLYGMGIHLISIKHTTKVAFNKYFTKRMLVLLGFGLLHLTFLWSGDILIPYAIIGLILIRAINLNSKVLLILAIILYFSESLLRIGLNTNLLLNTSTEHLIPYQNYVEINLSTNYYDILKLRLNDFLQLKNEKLINYVPKEFSFIIIGFIFARSKYFKLITTHTTLIRKFKYFKPSLTAVSILIILLYIFKIHLKTSTPGSIVTLNIKYLLYTSINFLQAIVYFCLLFICLKNKNLLRYLHPIASAGRMSLTNYLLQSAICSFIFYGYGLGYYTKLKPGQLIILVIVIYGFQIAISYLWIKKFQIGPLEFLWRKLSLRMTK